MPTYTAVHAPENAETILDSSFETSLKTLRAATVTGQFRDQLDANLHDYAMDVCCCSQRGLQTQALSVSRLENVMKEYMVDFTERMTAIQKGLSDSTSPGASEEDVQHAEALLEELNEIVESIDFARDLRSIGGLPVLMSLMQSPHTSLRWRAANVIATCCQNHLPVQVSHCPPSPPPHICNHQQLDQHRHTQRSNQISVGRRHDWYTVLKPDALAHAAVLCRSGSWQRVSCPLLFPCSATVTPLCA